MRRPPTWLGVALGVAAGFFVGVVLVVALGIDDDPGPTRTVTVVRRVPPPGDGETVVTRTRVPDLTGERLDVAHDRLDRAGFLVKEEDGGLFGTLVDSNWEVAEQDPAPGTLLERGSTVRLKLERR